MWLTDERHTLLFQLGISRLQVRHTKIQRGLWSSFLKQQPGARKLEEDQAGTIKVRQVGGAELVPVKSDRFVEVFRINGDLVDAVEFHRFGLLWYEQPGVSPIP